MPAATLVNGLLDCQGPPAEAAAEAAALLAAGPPYAALKVKVGRRADPLEDAAALLAIRAAVGPGVRLRADANRAWSLEQAVAFARAVPAAVLEYVEEPTKDPADLAELYRRTALPLALDESVDQGERGEREGGSSGRLLIEDASISSHQGPVLPGTHACPRFRLTLCPQA